MGSYFRLLLFNGKEKRHTKSHFVTENVADLSNMYNRTTVLLIYCFFTFVILAACALNYKLWCAWKTRRYHGQVKILHFIIQTYKWDKKNPIRICIDYSGKHLDQQWKTKSSRHMSNQSVMLCSLKASVHFSSIWKGLDTYQEWNQRVGICTAWAYIKLCALQLISYVLQLISRKNKPNQVLLWNRIVKKVNHLLHTAK